MKQIVFVLLLILTSFTWAALPTTNSDPKKMGTEMISRLKGLDQPHHYMCRSHKQVRTIRVEVQASQSRCQTLYNKQGKDRVIGSGRQLRACLGFLNNVKNNLVAARWKCKDVSRSMITVSGQSR